MQETEWYVITGGPGSGAGTLIAELSLLGYRTVQEAARVLINRYNARGITSDQLRKDAAAEAAFQKEVLRMKLEAENMQPTNVTVFYERGVPDSIPYYALCGLDATKLTQISRGRPYRKIFFLHPVPYRKDQARVEDETTARRIGEELRRTYVELGYSIFDVPVTHVEERRDIIISNL